MNNLLLPTLIDFRFIQLVRALPRDEQAFVRATKDQITTIYQKAPDLFCGMTLNQVHSAQRAKINQLMKRARDIVLYSN